ncbi:MAG: response regulator [Verrucomicrobiota bacterium]|jgi:DNA-binding response OmpR family regulator
MRGKILVVEDDKDELEMTRSVLETAGFTVGTATNGLDALKKTRLISPDLIVLDLKLPGINGFDVCETLRKDSLTASMPIVMVTGWGSQFARLAGFDSGVDEFLTKPFKEEELVSKVDKLLQARGSSKASQRG